MKDEWYGDNRDVVKWAAVVHLAQSRRIRAIVQVAFYRPSDERGDLEMDSSAVNLPKSVLNHFRNLDQIQGLAHETGLSIEIFKDPWPSDWDLRQAYIKKVTNKLSTPDRSACVVLLDPDTGIEPKRPDAKHVTKDEIGAIYKAMSSQDVLVLYQHARRTTGWLKGTRRAFAKAVNRSESDVETIAGRDWASDVVFFAVSGPGSGVGRQK